MYSLCSFLLWVKGCMSVSRHARSEKQRNRLLSITSLSHSETWTHKQTQEEHANKSTEKEPEPGIKMRLCVCVTTELLFHTYKHSSGTFDTSVRQIWSQQHSRTKFISPVNTNLPRHESSCNQTCWCPREASGWKIHWTNITAACRQPAQSSWSFVFL